MIDAGPSLGFAERLGIPELARYLVANGWQSTPSGVTGVAIFSKVVEGADRAAEFILPVKPGFEEEQRRIADALRTLEAIEHRSMSRIVDDVLRTSEPRAGVRGDARRLRANEPDPNSPFTKLAKLKEQLAKLKEQSARDKEDH